MNRLTFDLLDDLALAVARMRVDPALFLTSTEAERVGPFFELLMLGRMGIVPFGHVKLGMLPGALAEALEPRHKGRGAYAADLRARVGFIATTRDPNEDDQAEWIAFCRKAQEAAEFSMMPKPTARGLIGALREIETNVHEHSGDPDSGIVGFRGTGSDFEFAVMDSGIGILAGLRQSPDHKHLRDSGTAIRMALADGQSRLRYMDPGRGFGFGSLFLGLANLNGELRFRSDDHAVTIDGASPSLMAAQLVQRSPVKGFVASVVCRFGRGDVSH